ncbi:MAG: NUDIX hydrolase [Nitrospinae bacterium]|nr:NUDIX hydrolase [Nitrospinota bacterium]
MKTPRNPYLTVDVIIEFESEAGAEGVVMIERKNPPHGWALPGGFVDYGESLEAAATREALEETSLDVELIRQFHAYSDPKRDERQHNVTVVFIARPRGGALKARDDARRAGVFYESALPSEIAFDHADILSDYFSRKY